MITTKHHNQHPHKPTCSPLLLVNSLQRTALCFSLDHCFQMQKNIDRAAAGQDCQLKKKLMEIGYQKQEEHIEKYYKKGISEMSELTQYYKYYTQTSINYQPAFYKTMHNYRQQKKAVQYNRLKVMLDLSNSTHTNSSKTPRLQNSLASSFRILSLLQVTNTQESVLFQKLKDKLQKDYGPNRFNSVEELDKQYCFTKTIDLTASKQKTKLRRQSRKVTKQFVEKQSPLFRSKINNYTRNNSCGQVCQQSHRRSDSRGQIKRKKYGSMDNLHSLSQKQQKQTKTLPKQNKQSQIKRKIMGMKEQIKKQKQLLIRKAQSNRGKKLGTTFAKRLRT